MSFSVDLWNGIDKIKNQFNSTQRKLKTFSKLLTSYITIETNYYKGLENLYKEYKENSNPEYFLDQSYQKAIEIFENDFKNRKIFCINLGSLILEPINAYFEMPKTQLNKCYSDNFENQEIFNRVFSVLIQRQDLFHGTCKELSSYITQMEIDAIYKTNKTSKSKCQKFLEKVNFMKEDYLNCIKDTNKEREKYNNKTEEILNNLERMYKSLVELFQKSLTTFTEYRLEFFKTIIKNEQKDFEEIHKKVIPEKEIFDFIKKNATKEFPKIKFEFCPIKYSVLNKHVKNKYNKIPDKEFPKIYKAIKNYFDNNNVFKDDLIVKAKKKETDFFTRRFTFFSKKNIQNDNEEKDNLKENKEFVEKYLTDLFINKKSEDKKKEENLEKSETKEKSENEKEIKEKKNEINDIKETTSNENKDNNNIDKKDIKEEEKKDDSIKENKDNKDNKEEENKDNNNITVNIENKENEDNKEKIDSKNAIENIDNKEIQKKDNEIKEDNKNNTKENFIIIQNNENEEIKEEKQENENKDDKNKINNEENKIIEEEKKISEDKIDNKENKDNIKENDNNINDNNIKNEENKIIDINDKEKETEKTCKNEKNDYDELLDLINIANSNNFFYIEVVIKKLSYLRSKGFFKISEHTYNTVLSLFNKILDQYPKNDYILKNILILCQTFYKLEKNEKIYLQQIRKK